MKGKGLSLECNSCQREITAFTQVEVDDEFYICLVGRCHHCQKDVVGVLNLLLLFEKGSGNGDEN